MGMSDEALLNHLNVHPELRSRVESMLLVVVDEKGELQEADAAELRLIEEMRRMGQETLQAWATGQAAKAAEIVGQESGIWRGVKKTPVAQYIWRNNRRRGAVSAWEPTYSPICESGQSAPSWVFAAFAACCDGLRSRCCLRPSRGQTRRALRYPPCAEHDTAGDRSARAKDI